MYVIGFNGPPRSGKDTLADAALVKLQAATHSSERFSTTRVSLSMPMRIAAFGLLGRVYSPIRYEEEKDITQAYTGETLRETMIRLSEDFVKLNYGDDYWARLALKWMKPEYPGVILISDIGFEPEVEYIKTNYGFKNFLNVHLSRKGYEWGNDSRRYVGGAHTLTLPNDETPEIGASRILGYAKHQMEWDI